ncbi:MAG: hypothetical protein GXP32_05405 [Kiritimatiellaeota bacterium]|nr:hypothetical protein [Kiritimatiellota bacterium]
MSSDDQLSFDFDDSANSSPAVEKPVNAFETEREPAPPRRMDDENSFIETTIGGKPIGEGELAPPKELRPRDLRRAALAWVAIGNPSALAIGVPTRVSRFKADVAAVWTKPGRKRLVHPVKTLVVEVRRSRSDCWPDCSRREEMLAPLREIKAEKERLESILRETEPELRETDTLFEEFESWNYSASKNLEYRQCLKKMREIENSLYKGSRFERIAQANVADFLYLAVPVGAVDASELAEGWGLLHINDDLSVEVVKAADDIKCAKECKTHLALNIASSCVKSLLFSEGILMRKDGTPSFTPIPKRRRVKAIK